MPLEASGIRKTPNHKLQEQDFLIICCEDLGVGATTHGMPWTWVSQETDVGKYHLLV
jgi:hypothetical protein